MILLQRVHSQPFIQSWTIGEEKSQGGFKEQSEHEAIVSVEYNFQMHISLGL